MNSHFIIIGALIVIIVSIQVYVFSNTLKKINLFKSIFPKSKNFKTIKVYIPENQLDVITLESVMENLDLYQTPPEMQAEIDGNLDSNVDNEINKPKAIGIKYIIIGKGDEEKRIDSRYFENYYKEGWQFLRNDEKSTSSVEHSKIKRKRKITVVKGPLTEEVSIELANVYEKAGWSIVDNN